MFTKYLVAAVVLTALPGHHHRPGCHKLFTVPMTRRAGDAVYAGTRKVTKRELRMLGRMEMCQRNPRAAWYVRWFDHRQAALHKERLAPPVAVFAGWAIPWPIVKCESSGHNDSPNSVGASGYYQIIPSTWGRFKGYSEAYLAPKSVQDERAAQIWDGGRGRSQWVCAGLTGY